jgi:hypothetical protein
MDQFIFGIVTFLVIYLSIRAVRLYKNYKGNIYPHLFSSFFEYFYRYEIMKDCSKSFLLSKEIGTHRLLFSMAKNEKGEIAYHFVTVFYNKGIVVTDYLNLSGMIKSHKNDVYWYVKSHKDNKEYKIGNPEIALNSYRRQIDSVLENIETKTYITLNDIADTSGLKSEIEVVRYSDFVSLLKNRPADFISERMILESYSKYTNK